MVKEIYIRNENDPYFTPNTLDFTNEIESVITQIRMILGTRKGEVFGAPTFGFNIEDYVFRTARDAENICGELDDEITLHVYHSEHTKIKTAISFGDSGKGYDYAILDIYINGQKALGFLVDKNEK